jgi:hypothetical protein
MQKKKVVFNVVFQVSPRTAGSAPHSQKTLVGNLKQRISHKKPVPVPSNIIWESVALNIQQEYGQPHDSHPKH